MRDAPSADQSPGRRAAGFGHSAFTFAHESLVARSVVADADVPPGALITFLQKGLQYVEIESHLQEDGAERQCDEPFHLLTPHICRLKSASTLRRQTAPPGELLSRIRPSPSSPHTHSRALHRRRRHRCRRRGFPRGRPASSGSRLGSRHVRLQPQAPRRPRDRVRRGSRGARALPLPRLPPPRRSGDGTARIWTIDPVSGTATHVVLRHSDVGGAKGAASAPKTSRDVSALDWSVRDALPPHPHPPPCLRSTPPPRASLPPPRSRTARCS